MRIEFWGAAGEVTGSCFLIQCGRHKLLVDCGLIQGKASATARNGEPFPFDPRRVDAVILTHAHLDHSGRLPRLVREGFRGNVYTHPATRDLCRIMLLDAAHLAEQDAEFESRRRARKGRAPVGALYTSADVERTMKHFRALEYERRLSILPGIEVRLRDAGHILGSAVAEVWLSEHGRQRKLVFSGDLGHAGAPLLRDPAAVREADLVLMESTYGDRDHRPWQATWDELADVLDRARAHRGNILIPSFAVGRTQELLYAFRRNYGNWGMERWQVFLDSPMAIQATELYARHQNLFDAETAAALARGDDPFRLPNLHITPRAEDSMATARIRSGAIIIAGSGMCEGGRIRHHLRNHLPRADSHVVVVGYQAAGTLGRKLVDGAPSVRIWSEAVPVKARIHTIGGLSAHAGQSGLIRWYRQFTSLPPVCLVHGEPAARDMLRERLFHEQGVSALCPAYGSALDLNDEGMALQLRQARTTAPAVVE